MLSKAMPPKEIPELALEKTFSSPVSREKTAIYLAKLKILISKPKGNFIALAWG